VTTPISGIVCFHRLELNIVKWSTKFEVSMFTHYENMKCNTKCKKWGGFGRLGVTEGNQHNHSIKHIYFLFDFDRNYASILYSFPVIMSYLLKVADLTHPTCIWRSCWGWPCSNFPVLSRGIICMILCLAILTQYWHVMDKHTHTHTHTHTDTWQKHIPY